jgi:hypothetical protein
MPKKPKKDNSNNEISQTNFQPGEAETVRLAELQNSPSLNDLYQVLESAKTELGRKFELVWKFSQDSPGYILSVGCPADQGIPPDWCLVMPDGSAAWTYLGDDVALIQLHVRNLAGFGDAGPPTPAFPDFSFPALNSADASNPFPFGEIGKIATVELADTEPFMAPIAGDFATLRHHHEMLLQPETGILSQWWMMYFLEQEYYRYKACSFPVTLAVFDLTMLTTNGQTPLSVSHIKQIGQRVTNAKRKIDLFGHFGSTLYALMLPHTEIAAGTMVANRIKNQITGDRQAQGWDNSQISVRMGIAAIPTNAQELNGLIVEAVENLKVPETVA